MSGCELEFMLLLSGPFLVLSTLAISLFLSKYGIDGTGFNFILNPMFIVLRLGFFEHVINVESLGIEKGISLPFKFFLLLLYANLLFAPIFLL